MLFEFEYKERVSVL